MDLAALALLATWAWRDRETRTLRASAPEAAGFLLGFGLTVAVLLSVTSVGFGSVAGARASLRGDEVYLDPPTVDLATVSGGETTGSWINVFNASRGDVRVVGGTANCACTLIPDLPVTIPPGQSWSLQIWVKAPTDAGVFRLRATLWTDSPTNQTIPVLLRGRSVGP